MQEQMEAHLKKISEYYEKCPEGSVNEFARSVFVNCDSEKKTYVAGYDTDSRSSNPNGTLHGGLIAMAMDTSMGNLANFYGEQRMTQTISFQISFLRPGVVGDRLMVRAKLSKRGRAMQYLSAEAWMDGDEERLIATATGVYYTQGDKRELA